MPAAQKLRSINPATNEVLGEVPVSTPDEVRAAVTAARTAQPAWRALGVAGRVAVLEKLYKDFIEHREALAKLTAQEMGNRYEASLKGIDSRLKHVRWNLDNAAAILAPETTFEDEKELHQIHYEPFGVYAVISPWNVPFSNFIMTCLQPLLAGNTVVYKVSEEVPMFGVALNEAFTRAKIPAGVFNQVFGVGDVGEALARSEVDHIHFTGSTAVGEKLYKIAAEKFVPITLELGGSDAGIVFEDADIDRMIEPIFWARFSNAGQICCALKRLFVHKSRYEELVAKLTAFIKTQKVGDPMESDTALGPLVSEKQRQLLAAQLDDALAKGVKVLLGGSTKPPRAGAYFEPTLLTDLKPDMRVSREELFGPVLSIATFESEEEVIRRANATPYGLSVYIYTEDRTRLRRVAAQLQAGSVSHNGIDYFKPANPFGGFKHSGLGRTGGKIGLQACCQIKVVTVEK